MSAPSPTSPSSSSTSPPPVAPSPPQETSPPPSTSPPTPPAAPVAQPPPTAGGPPPSPPTSTPPSLPPPNPPPPPKVPSPPLHDPTSSPPPALLPPPSSPSDSQASPSTPVVVPSPPTVPIGTDPSPGSQTSSPASPTMPTTPPSPQIPPSMSTPVPSTIVTPPVTPTQTNTTPSSSSSSLNMTTPSSENSSASPSSTSQGAFVGIAVAGALIALVAIVFVVSRKWKRRMNGSVGRRGHPPSEISPKTSPSVKASYRIHGVESIEPGGSKSWFTYEELMGITNGFSREYHIGEGGFGPVYKGVLPDGRQVAVKQLKAGSGQGEREFRAEVEIIGRVHHRHLVSLVGYCIAEHHRLLVYDFVSNKTLEHHLHGEGLPVLDWSKRMRIAIGSARGLAYLHEDCHPRIIHRDIKSANILLDGSFEAQVADFGLAKLSNDAHTHVSTRVMGTFGYLAPEYASSGKLTDKSDVYSFGVVLLELITGRKPIDASQPLEDESLVEWARPRLIHALETGDYEELVDPRLQNNFVKAEMSRMIEAAAACVRHSAPKRPRMVQVLRALDSGGSLPDLSNGVKFGQSTVYDSGQYCADIEKLRKMTFESDIFSTNEYDSSGEHGHGSSINISNVQ